MADWTITPIEADLSRVYDPISQWTTLTLVERHNQPDTWTIEGPSSVLEVFTAGSGCLLDRDGQQVTSGYVRSIDRAGKQEDDQVVDTMTVGFVSHLSALFSRDVLPSPMTVLTQQVSSMADAHDIQTGPAEDVILHYVRAALGDLTVSDRRLSHLRIPDSLHRGPSATTTARLNVLGELVTSLAETAGLRLRVLHGEPGPYLNLVIDTVEDVSADVSFGPSGSTSAGLISEWAYSIEEPTMTRAIVAASGELTERRFLQVVDSDAEALWGRVQESIVDQRQTDQQSEMVRAATEELAKGASPIKVSFTPVLGPDLVFRRDVRVGDIVGYDLPGLDLGKDVVRQATTTVTATSSGATEQVAVVVGTPDAPTTRSQRQVVTALRGVNAIQRSE